jgi:tetratricopeptide (TPR) repeat protein
LKIKTFPSLFFVLSLFFNLSLANANYKEKLAEIYLHYSKAEYQEALKKLKGVKGVKEIQGLVHYWNGKVYSKTQEFDKADIEFKKAVQKKAKIKDLYYSYGQALYASQELEKSRKYFLASAKNKFKPGASYYYSGIISQLLEEHKKAKKYYKKIVKLKEDKEGVKKPSLFQIANLNYERVLKLKNKAKVKNLVVKVILPQMVKARDFKKENALTATIKNRINSLKRKHRIGIAERMSNGRRIPRSPWTTNLTIGVKNDTNILSTTNDDPSGVASGYTDFSGLLKYQANAQKTFSFIPGLSLSTKRHLKRDNSSIYKNDNLSIDPSLAVIWEQKAFNSMAKTMLNIDYNYIMQDPNAQSKLEYYSNHLVFSIGQEFRPFSMGDTTLKFKYKDKKAYTSSLENKTTTISLSQRIKFGKSSSMGLTFNADFNVYKASPTSDTNDYKTTLDFGLPKKFFGSFTLSPSYSFTLTDNVFNATKGKETTHDPSLKIKRRWKNLDANLNYAFTKKTSEDEGSSYSKHVFGFGMTYTL